MSIKSIQSIPPCLLAIVHSLFLLSSFILHPSSLPAQPALPTPPSPATAAVTVDHEGTLIHPAAEDFFADHVTEIIAAIEDEIGAIDLASASIGDIGDVATTDPAASHTLVWDPSEDEWANRLLTIADLADIDTGRILGRATAETGPLELLTPAQARALLDVDQAGAGGAVTTVFGRDGAVTAQAGDYTWAQIDLSASALADIADIDDTDIADGRLLSWSASDSAHIYIAPPTTGATAFTGLSDTPASYSGQALRFLRVNTNEDGIEFVAVAPGDFVETLDDLTDVAIDALQDAHALLYDSAGGEWINRPLTESDISDLGEYLPIADKATQAQAEAGEDNLTWMTPLRTAQAIAELAGEAGGEGSTFLDDWAGVWTAETAYGQSALVRHDDALWVALDATVAGVEPGGMGDANLATITTTQIPNIARSVRMWEEAGDYLIAVGHNISPRLTLFRWDGNNLTTEDTSTLPNTPEGMDIWEDGGVTYIAAAHVGGITVLSYSGGTLQQVDTFGTVLSYFRVKSFVLNGERFIAATAYSNGINIFSWDGNEGNFLHQTAGSGYAWGLYTWQQGDDAMLAVGLDGDPRQLAVYSWDGEDTTLEDIFTPSGASLGLHGWDDSGDHLLAVPSYNFPGLQLVKWNGTDLVWVEDHILPTNDPHYVPKAVHTWADGDDRIMAVAQRNPGLSLIRWDGSEMSTISTIDYPTDSWDIHSISGPGGRLIASVYDSGDSFALHLYNSETDQTWDLVYAPPPLPTEYPILRIENFPGASWTDFEIKGMSGPNQLEYYYHSPDPDASSVASQIYLEIPHVWYTDSGLGPLRRQWKRQPSDASIAASIEDVNSYVGGWIIFLRGVTRDQFERWTWTYSLGDGTDWEVDPADRTIWRTAPRPSFTTDPGWDPLD